MLDRNYNISFIRFISLLMIISCHILQGIGSEIAYWVNLGVQIFFFMSGYLYGTKNIVDYKNFYKNKLLKILLPTIIVIAIMILIEKFIFNSNYSNFYIISNLLGFGGFSKTLQTLTHTWFVSYILICYLITPILQSLFKNNKNNIHTLFIITLVIILFKNFNVILINHIWIINYILGYFFSKCCTTKKQKSRFFFIVFSLSIALLPLALILQHNLVNNIPINIMRWKIRILDWEHVLLGSALFIVFYKTASKCNIKYNAILKFSDKYSFFIYLTHQIFILNHLSLLRLTNNLFINILIIYLASILSGILLCFIYQSICITINSLKEFINIKKRCLH